ncbi:VCBS repeat-containing protein [Breoghania sp. L-A4]|uniref:FG-GAP repeat domain-containing protein n=1 Tax=Breoghania sp. L-A4 TaxID=2304600 RepID=UPI0020BDC603|nr:VCBS repeat-containing protein [Breoghania sp. L-A4]
MPIPILHEEAEAAGITHTYDGPWEYFVGGGVAVLDCNGDRKPDLFLAGGTNDAKLFVNDSRPGGALAFHDQPTGLDARHLTKVTGAYPLDIDNDGHLDLAILRVGENLLLKGGPDCTFELANKAWGFDGGRAWTTAFAAQWEPENAYPTLAFGNYVDRSAPARPGAPATTTRCSARKPPTGPTIPLKCRCGRAIAPCRWSSPTGTAPASLPCASRTTATTTAAARNSSGPSPRTGRRAPIAAPMAGGI